MGMAKEINFCTKTEMKMVLEWYSERNFQTEKALKKQTGGKWWEKHIQEVFLSCSTNSICKSEKSKTSNNTIETIILDGKTQQRRKNTQSRQKKIVENTKCKKEKRSKRKRKKEKFVLSSTKWKLLQFNTRTYIRKIYTHIFIYLQWPNFTIALDSLAYTHVQQFDDVNSYATNVST